MNCSVYEGEKQLVHQMCIKPEVEPAYIIHLVIYHYLNLIHCSIILLMGGTRVEAFNHLTQQRICMKENISDTLFPHKDNIIVTHPH